MKCKSGFKQVNGRCVKKGLFGRIKEGGMKGESQEKETSRTLKFIIAPLLGITLLLFFIIPSLQVAFGLYFVMTLFGLVAFMVPKIRNEAIGINNKIGMPLLLGISTAGGFFLISKLIPGFSMLLPNISYSVAQGLRGFIILFVAPGGEEILRSSSIAILYAIYKPKRFWGINIAQSTLFALMHTLVYGILLSAYDTWIQAFGAFYAILGSILSAFVFALISGYLMKKTGDMKASMIAHFIINLILFSSQLVVVAVIGISLLH